MGGAVSTYYLPGRENGEWKFLPVNNRKIEKDKFEKWKTKFYRLEGWDPDSGWPRRDTLKGLGLEAVAAELEQKGRLGKG